MAATSIIAPDDLPSPLQEVWYDPLVKWDQRMGHGFWGQQVLLNRDGPDGHKHLTWRILESDTLRAGLARCRIHPLQRFG